MGSRPRLRAAAASRLDCVGHIAHDGSVGGEALGSFHGLTPTATCCRRFAAGLRWAYRQAGTVRLVPWAHAHGYVLPPLRGWIAFGIGTLCAAQMVSPRRHREPVPWAHAHGYVLPPLRGWIALGISPRRHCGRRGVRIVSWAHAHGDVLSPLRGWSAPGISPAW